MLVADRNRVREQPANVSVWLNDAVLQLAGLLPARNAVHVLHEPLPIASGNRLHEGLGIVVEALAGAPPGLFIGGVDVQRLAMMRIHHEKHFINGLRKLKEALLLLARLLLRLLYQLL